VKFVEEKGKRLKGKNLGNPNRDSRGPINNKYSKDRKTMGERGNLERKSGVLSDSLFSLGEGQFSMTAEG